MNACPACGFPTPYNVCLSFDCAPDVVVTTDARGNAHISPKGWCPVIREADRRHDFETEGRQDQRTETPCATCGLARNSALHS